MKLALVLAAGLAASVLPAAAQDGVNLATGQPYVAPDDIPAGVYSVVAKETLVRYEVRHFGYSTYWGTFSAASGTLAIDPKNLAAAKLDVKVPIWSIQTSSKELDEEFYSNQFFDGEVFRNMHFVSTSVTRTGRMTARVAGDLTIHNITHPVVLDVTFMGAGPAPKGFGDDFIIAFRAEGDIKRSDFGVGKYVPVVSDETHIVISTSLKKT
jgi:polyisoprenoid-binding protein YceI